MYLGGAVGWVGGGGEERGEGRLLENHSLIYRCTGCLDVGE